MEEVKIPIISLALSAAALILTSACPFGMSVGLGTLLLNRRFSSAETEVQGYWVWPWTSYWEGIVVIGRKKGLKLLVYGVEMMLSY